MGKTETTVQKITKPCDVVLRMFNDFTMIEDSVKRRMAMKGRKICKHLEPCVDLMGKTPNSIASAVILYIVGEQVSKAEVANICKISAPTLNKIESIVKKYLEENVPIL
jgi:hypothetical protein